MGVWFSEPGAIPMLHTALALAILALIVIHVYMTGTGHFLFAHIKAMITGWGMWMGVSP